MTGLRKTAQAVIPFFILGSSTAVSAPSFAENAAATGSVRTKMVANIQAPAANAKLEAAERLSKSADALAKKRLAAYVLSRYGNAPKSTRDRFAANFESLSKSDPAAETHPYYLVSLEKRIVDNPVFKEDGSVFGAYAHLLLTLRDSRADVDKMALDRKVELENTLKEATLGKIWATSPKERSEAFKTFATLGLDPWSSEDLSKMRKSIEERRIGPDTRYFKAYAFARSRLANGSWSLSLLRGIPHSKQEWSLSCEANSMRDLINYYRLGNGESIVPESTFVFLLPTDSSLPRYQNGTRIWGDPDRAFVGKIDGRQSANPAKLTGYGIHADGILPYVKRELKKYGLTAQKKPFDSDSIRDSLAAGHPVFFWYVLGADPSRWLSRLDWKTEEGKEVTGYVGQHVGVIVGAKISNDGKIGEVSYYEGRTSTLQKESFDSLSRKAKWFDEAIYVASLEELSVPKKTDEPTKVIPVRKKNLKAIKPRTGVSN